MNSWLLCKIGKGMFSDEVTVTVTTSAGENVAVFVPRGRVNNAQSRVSVKRFDQGDRAYAILPDAERTTVPVKTAELTPA